MANNRMALVCKDCKVGVAIAKYYPMASEDEDAGWYVPNNKTELLNDFFQKHKHNYDLKSFAGGNQYYLGYENDETGWQYEHLIES